jgi:hypothetical protein
VGGVTAKKVRFKDPVPGTTPQLYQRVVLKGRVCRGLPGNIAVTVAGSPAEVFMCGGTCDD